jgi:hypothetical protein
MASVFSVQTVLLQTSNSLLRELLARLGHADLGIPWDDLDEDDYEPIDRALKTLPADRYDLAEAHFRTVYDLARGSGIAAIREAAECLGRVAALADMPLDDGVYDTVVWAWLRDSELVEFAGLIHQVEQLSWWRRRTDLPKGEPDARPETLLRLGQELSALLEAEQGRGRRCTVQFLARTRTRYYFAYPDDYVQNVTAHDDRGVLRARTFRQTFSVVFAFDPAAGALELYAGRISPRIKQQIEAVFASVIFAHPLAEWVKPTYNLESLKFRGTPLSTDPADRVRVSVCEIRLEVRATKEQITLKTSPTRDAGDVYDMIDQLLNRERVPLTEMEVKLIGFCFEFLDASLGRGRRLMFHVAMPNTCSLRNQRQDRIDLAVKYLAQWGIYVQRPDPGLAEAR